MFMLCDSLSLCSSYRLEGSDASVSSSKGTQTPSSSTVHILKDTRAELTECMGVGADELAPACRGPVRGPSTDGAERQTLAKWFSLPQHWQTFPLAGHV